MKFYAYCVDKTLADCNGGSMVLWHHLHALEELGHEAGGMLNLDEPVPEDADFIMFQGEWWYHLKTNLENSNAKRICWLGHFKPGSDYQMPKIKEIEADYFHTQWVGACVDYAEEQIGKKIYYLPHAGCGRCNVRGIKHIEYPKAVFIGNQFKERSYEWLHHSNVAILNAPFDKIKDYYASAVIAPNLHGDFQKGITTEFTKIPGMMVNERIFQVFLSGGFCISDNNPLVKDFFNLTEVQRCETKEEYKHAIDYYIANPQMRRQSMNRAKAKILNEHLYTHRWRDYLKTIL